MPVSIFSLVDALTIPLVLIGPAERIAHANAPAQQLVATGAVGRHYITALRQPGLVEAIELTFADRQTRIAAYLGAEGARDTTWRVTVAPVVLESGQGVVLSFEDVTAVTEAGQMRRDFVANVSHELRTPLTALLGFIETLKGAARDDAAARMRFLDIMHAEAGRMAQLVQDLLSLSRVEEEERVRPMAPVDLPRLIRSVIATFAARAEAAGMAIDLHLPADPVVVPGDSEQLRQVLNNLIENAIKYGGSGKPVTIALTAPAEETVLRTPGVRLSVADQGEGIAAHHIPRLTERFYRVDTHRSRQVGGTGLGLAIVKHIVNRHRGRLKIESTPGQGSSFTVILPLI